MTLSSARKTILEEIDSEIWLTEGEIVSFYGFPYPTRSIIVRFGTGAIWIWSPIKLTPELKAAIDSLGPVTYLVSPNKIHHLYLQDWKARYPDAQLWGPESTIKKRRDLSFREPLTDTPPAAWQPEIDQAWFRGSVALDEVVFFHRPSRTVILADLIENFSASFLRSYWKPWQRVAARLDGITWRKPGAPRELRWSFVNRRLARAARDKVLRWHGDRVTMAHGDWQRSDGSAFLKRSLSWLGR